MVYHFRLWYYLLFFGQIGLLVRHGVDVILSMCRLLDVVLRTALPTTHRVTSHADERWQQSYCDNVLALWSDKRLYCAAERRQLYKVTFVFPNTCGNEDTWSLAVFLDGHARRTVSRT